MLTRALASTAVLAASFLPTSGTGADGSAGPGFDLIAEDDTIGAGITIPDAVRPGDPGSVVDGCHWRYYTYSVIPPDPGDEFSQRPFIREHPVTGRLQVAVDYVCADVVVGIGWVDADPPPLSELLAGPTTEVRRRLPAPLPMINPSGAATVNLGLWLGVAPTAPITATATLLGHRASVTATHVATRFDMGDDTIVRCVGSGSILTLDDPGRASVAPGPCGHVYRRPTPPGQPHRVIVTMEWSVSYITSTGRGSLSSLSTSTELEMSVAEIQSIGVG